MSILDTPKKPLLHAFFNGLLTRRQRDCEGQGMLKERVIEVLSFKRADAN